MLASRWLMVASLAVLGAGRAEAQLHAPRLEARAIFGQPVRLSPLDPTPKPLAKAAVLFEENFLIAQKAMRTMGPISVPGDRPVQLGAEALFGAWSYNGEIRLCYADTGFSLLTGAKGSYICLRDTNGDQAADQSVVWKNSGDNFWVQSDGDHSELSPAVAVVQVDTATAIGVQGAHYRLVGMRVRVAEQDRRQAKFVVEGAEGRIDSGDGELKWRYRSIEKADVSLATLPTSVALKNVRVDINRSSDGGLRASVTPTVAWLTLSSDGTEVTAHDRKIGRIFSWASDPCTTTGRRLISSLTGGGCDKEGPQMYDQDRPPQPRSRVIPVFLPKL